MKNHRRLKNSPLLKFAIFAVLGLCLIPLLPAAVTPHGLGSIAAAGMIGIPMMKMEQASDPANPDAIGIPDAIKAIEDKTMPMAQRLTVAVKALQGVDPTGQLATVKADLDTAKTDLTTRDAEITKLKADLDLANQRITALESDVASADQARADAEKTSADLQAKEKDVAKRADALAKEKIAALGFNSNQLPPQNTEHQGNDDAGEKSPEARIRKLEGNQRIVAAMHFQKHGKLPDFMNN
jgi:hypothetical protein